MPTTIHNISAFLKQATACLREYKATPEGKPTQAIKQLYSRRFLQDVGIEIEGPTHDEIAALPPAIFVANHASMLDALLICVLFDKQVIICHCRKLGKMCYAKHLMVFRYGFEDFGEVGAVSCALYRADLAARKTHSRLSRQKCSRQKSTNSRRYRGGYRRRCVGFHVPRRDANTRWRHARLQIRCVFQRHTNASTNYPRRDSRHIRGHAEDGDCHPPRQMQTRTIGPHRSAYEPQRRTIRRRNARTGYEKSHRGRSRFERVMNG